MNNNEIVSNNARINTLLGKLKNRLKKFIVIDRQGEQIGEVKDLILDNERQLNLVVSRFDTDINLRLVLLVSKLIQKIDPPNKSVLVDTNKAEIGNLPEYLTSETPTIDFSETADDSNRLGSEATTEDIVLSEDQSNETLNVPDSTIDEIITPLIKSPEMQNEVEDEITVSSVNDEEELIRLLEERLIVDRSRRKVGEVIVRKEVETRMVQVPVRYEKLVVEQVTPEHKQLAEISLGQEQTSGIELVETAIKQGRNTSLAGEFTVSGEFNSPKTASLLLNAIALERRHGCQRIRIEIVVEDAERQKTYEEWFARSSSGK